MLVLGFFVVLAIVEEDRRDILARLGAREGIREEAGAEGESMRPG